MKFRKWIINARGYATITPSEGDVVYGFVYKLTLEDEGKLDRYEAVPVNYIKEMLPIELIGDEGKVIDGLVYVDVERTTEGVPKMEYIYRMNMAIADGIKQGIPKEYVEKYLRPFIPEVVQN